MGGSILNLLFRLFVFLMEGKYIYKSNILCVYIQARTQHLNVRTKTGMNVLSPESNTTPYFDFLQSAVMQ
jgi:hypothetical protein